MKKRYIKAIKTSNYREEELPIEECINRYAEDNDLIIIQFQIHSCTDASVLFEENFERGFVRKVIDYPNGERYGSVTRYECSECGYPVWETSSKCDFCNTKFFDEPSN